MKTPKIEKSTLMMLIYDPENVSIIHGFGTGVIREMVINFLKFSPYVESFRFGGAGEGGQGVTIVTLKH